jgi:ubiquinone/menaquinone biosynthesis C-methylase UbiE
MLRTDLERDTGQLFGKLWAPYDNALFEQSVNLFSRRLALVDFDPEWLRGQTVLDAGCGGGRNSLAMARLGAGQVHAVDIAAQGVETARQRTSSFSNVKVHHASVLDLPFPDRMFDMVWCAGVLMITDDADHALSELVRVLKPGGILYLLVYATEGLRWPLIQTLRPIAAQIGETAIDRAVDASGMAPNSRSMFLDDLFCPKLDFFSWDRLRRMLEKHQLTGISRWPKTARLDHEQDLGSYRADLETLGRMWEAGADIGIDEELFRVALALTRATIETIAGLEHQVEAGAISRNHAETVVIGQGHHRLFARKGYQ